MGGGDGSGDWSVRSHPLVSPLGPESKVTDLPEVKHRSDTTTETPDPLLAVPTVNGDPRKHDDTRRRGRRETGGDSLGRDGPATRGTEREGRVLSLPADRGGRDRTTAVESLPVT